MINNYVYYQKRKNQNLFKSLENPGNLFLSYTQNYIPIYKRFFDLNENNFNNINLNHPWYLYQISKEKESNHSDSDSPYNENVLECILKHKDTDISKRKLVFFKLAPLLDPFKFLVGKYSNDNTIYNLPSLQSNESNVNSKILDVNNSAYVDGFFLFLTSKLHHHLSFQHGIDYYGSFLSIKNNYKINIYDDLEYLNNSDFFIKNKNKLFMVDDYDHLFSLDKPKLKPIKIEYSTSLKSNLSISSLPQMEYENLFESVKPSFESSSLDEIKTFIIEENENGRTTSLKSNSSGSSCSSRTSRTSSCSNENDSTESIDNSEDTLYDNQSNSDSGSKLDSLNSFKGKDEWEELEGGEGKELEGCEGKEFEEELEEELEEDEEEEEEIIEAKIPQFPVQVICMEHCEITLDELLLNNKLSKEEWFSALMQIIMILITYQKMFAFTHNDLHTNNIMFNETKKKFLFYKYKNILYKVPTFGRIFKIIDFGRSIYKLNGETFCSDIIPNHILIKINQE